VHHSISELTGAYKFPKILYQLYPSQVLPVRLFVISFFLFSIFENCSVLTLVFYWIPFSGTS